MLEAIIDKYDIEVEPRAATVGRIRLGSTVRAMSIARTETYRRKHCYPKTRADVLETRIKYRTFFPIHFPKIH